MKHQLPPLPYSFEALAPHLSPKTLEFHYSKHHQGYVTKLNELLSDSHYQNLSLEEVIVQSHKDKKTAIFNNAAQVWNHTFYWNCLSLSGGGTPKGNLLKMIEKSFGSFAAFKENFKNEAIAQFGSGWVWVVLDPQNKEYLKIIKTSNADLPLIYGQTALLTCDVWEHAYYLDYQNRRADYISVFLESLVNWEFVEQQLLKG